MKDVDVEPHAYTLLRFVVNRVDKEHSPAMRILFYVCLLTLVGYLRGSTVTLSILDRSAMTVSERTSM